MSGWLLKWNVWKRDKALRQAREQLAACREELSALDRRLEKERVTQEHEIVLLRDDRDRWQKQAEALTAHNAVLAASHAILNDLRDHKPVTADEALSRLSPQFDDEGTQT